MNKIPFIKLIKTLSLGVVVSIFMQQSIFANIASNYDFVAIIYQKVEAYKCPHHNPILHDQLIKLVNNSALMQQICAKNPSPAQCNSGIFSLKNEATGFAHIVQDANSTYCSMANETKAELGRELGMYLK